MTHIAESTHWYSADGSPAYEVTGANGKLRPTTLRDARKMDLVPSVTTVIRCASAPGLEYWKIKQAVMAALTYPGMKGDDGDIALVIADSKAQAKKAAERGTMIHAAIQGHYEGQPPAPDFWPHVKAAKETVEGWIQSNWTPEKSFCHRYGFGGKVDLSCPSAVLDFKTKEFGPDDKLDTWDEHAMQLAAYRVGLGIPDARCAIVYVSASNPGLARLLEINSDDLANGWQMFQGLLSYWQAKNKYWPSEKLAA